MSGPTVELKKAQDYSHPDRNLINGTSTYTTGVLMNADPGI